MNDGLIAHERLATPVAGDEGEQAVLDPVPLRGSGRIVVDVEGKAGLVGELLQLDPAPLEPPQSAVIKRLRASG